MIDNLYYIVLNRFVQEQDFPHTRRIILHMNVYDFDNTILHGDSTARFFSFCLLRTPRMWLDVPRQLGNALLFLTHRREKQAFKERMFRFFTMIGDMDTMLEQFWDKNFLRVKPFYGKIHQADDVVISASPEFLIRPACERLQISHIMGSPVDSKTGRYQGTNCHGHEKVRRFHEVFPQGTIDDFYSDSYSDQPLADIARRAFLVHNQEILPWDGNNRQKQ